MIPEKEKKKNNFWQDYQDITVNSQNQGYVVYYQVLFFLISNRRQPLGSQPQPKLKNPPCWQQAAIGLWWTQSHCMLAQVMLSHFRSTG